MYQQVSIPATSHGGTQSRVDRMVIHGTVGPCTPGHSVNIANYLNSIGLSAHKVVDPTTCTTMLPDNIIGWHDGHNTDEVGMELCDPQAGDAARWSDPAHVAMLAIAAVEVRAICIRNNIPMRRIVAPLGTQRGICGHKDVSNTWHESTHQDPDTGGAFPWDHFIALVNGTPQEVDMTPAELFAATISTGKETVTVAQVLARTYTETYAHSARLSAIEAAINADPGNPVSQDMLNAAVAKGLEGANITVTPGGAA